VGCSEPPSDDERYYPFCEAHWKALPEVMRGQMDRFFEAEVSRPNQRAAQRVYNAILNAMRAYLASKDGRLGELFAEVLAMEVQRG
jgi:hypothetical protein